MESDDILEVTTLCEVQLHKVQGEITKKLKVASFIIYSYRPSHSI